MRKCATLHMRSCARAFNRRHEFESPKEEIQHVCAHCMYVYIPLENHDVFEFEPVVQIRLGSRARRIKKKKPPKKPKIIKIKE